MTAHAKLSPSSSSRWLACTVSPSLEAQLPKPPNTDASEEGTVAHKLAEYKIQLRLGEIDDMKYGLLVLRLNPRWYNQDMENYVNAFVDFVFERFNAAKAVDKMAALYSEQRLDLTKWIPEGFGTGDVVILANDTMEIIDLKYGRGVKVDAEENKQMMIYALGAIEEFGWMYDIRKARMTIYQPRIDNIVTFEMPAMELLRWAEGVLKPTAEMAWNGEGEATAGKHCRWCAAKAICRANADYNLELAKHEFKQPVFLNNEEIGDIMNRADSFLKWIKAVQDHALTTAVRDGAEYPGWKLVEGKTNRRYTDEEAVMLKATELGYKTEEIVNMKVKGLGDMEKLMGKKVFAEQFKDLIIKPAGSPTLAVLSDKREPYSDLEKIKKEFQAAEDEDLTDF